MAWSAGTKFLPKEGLVGHEPRPKCPFCGDTDCVCPELEHAVQCSAHSVKWTQFVGHGRPPRCPICRDTDCVCPPFEHTGLCAETARRCVKEPRPKCLICGDTDCVCPPFEGTGFFRAMARGI